MVKINTFSGSAKKVAAAYGKHFQREIAGFFSQEFDTYNYSKNFVRACSKVMKKDAPFAAAFVEGIATRSLLSVEEHTLLLLHEEELYHRQLNKKTPHCSAVGMNSASRKSKGAIVGENWDWNTSYFPWMSINRFAFKGKPSFVSHSYPGLPACAGLNSSGLALMWTGSGYFPPLIPKVGVPTYALVLETLLKQDVPSAIEYLQSASNAGAFIFFLGDSKGRLAIVEDTPGNVFVEHTEFGHRANIFEGREAVIASKQKLPGPNKCHSLKRNKVFMQTSQRLKRRPSVKGVQSILSQPTILIKETASHVTLMQLVADCRRRELMFRSWMEDSWSRVRV